MHTFCIWIVSPPSYSHSHAFDEVALALQAAFTDLGQAVPIVRDPVEIRGVPIILGANLLHHIPSNSIPPDSILFNLEQILPGADFIPSDYIHLLRNYRVWDYSLANLRELALLGVERAAFCGIGYHPVLTRIPPAPVQDIDVLLYGSIIQRRAAVIEQLKALGYHTQILFNVYGAERDAWIARAKIVLNVHLYGARVFEIVRVSYLLANRVFVLSERGSDSELEKQLKGGLVFSPYNNLVDEAVHFLKKDALRQKIAARGFELFRSISQTELLRAALQSLD